MRRRLLLAVHRRVVSRGMSANPPEWTEESDIFTVDLSGGTLVLRARPGQEAVFSDFARDIIDRVGDFAAFPRLDSDGRYDSVQIMSDGPPTLR